MKIVDISVDGFGVWRDLELAELSDKVTVFYGPNEAGKTTLMNFIRAVLYGCEPEHGRRYLPPLRGGEPGGRLVIDAAKGRFSLARHQYDGVDRVVLTTADGEPTHRGALLDLLSGCDETIFRNVYAIGLREIQELGTLSDTEASRHLYDLSVGLDRVSLPDVMRELSTAREHLLSDGESSSRIGQLIQRREELQLQIKQSDQSYHEFLRLADQQTQLERSIEQTEERRKELEQQARRAELAHSLHDKWEERAGVDEEIGRLGDVPTLPDDAIQKLEQLTDSIDENQRERVALKAERKRLRDEATAFPVNDRLTREAPRIEALGLQREWIASLETEINALDADAAQLEANVSAARQESLLGTPLAGHDVSAVSDGTMQQLRQPARTMRDARDRRNQCQGQSEQQTAEVTRLNREIEAKLSKHGAKSLDDALGKAGNEAAELRRRIQLDERLEQLEGHQADLEEQGQRLLERQQIMPVKLLAGIGAGVVLGILLVLVGLFLPSVGTIGWALALLGIGSAGIAVAAKFVLEKTAARDLEQCEQQLDMITDQRQQLSDERDELDRTMPKHGGPLAVRLREAEKKVAELEQLLPLDSQRDAAQQLVDAGEIELQQLSNEYREARGHWMRALANLGLPTDLSPTQVKELAQRGAEVGRLNERFELQRGQADERRRHLATCSQRVAELTRTLQLPAAGHTTLDRLDALMQALDEQHQHVAARDELQEKARLARRKQMQHAAAVDKLTTKRTRLLTRAGVTTVTDYRKAALASTRKTLLVRQREQLTSEITTAIKGVCEESVLAEHFADASAADLERQWEKLADQVIQADARSRELFQQRGGLEAQLERFRGDTQTQEAKFELGCVEQQLKEAAGRWQELAVTSDVLEGICRRYERDQQPATLQEASRYLRQMTDGHYQRVWTPLGENRLIVDDADGNPLPPEVLSRGTREQLFLSLRMALASLYVQRGVRLPLVLDDVLVNFDAGRAKAAAKALREFAAAGHQVLIFTCHEHMVKMFKTLRVDTRTLPDNSAVPELTVAAEPELEPVVEVEPVEPEPIEVEPVKVEKPKKPRKKAKPKKKKKAKPPVEEVVVEEPVIEEVVEEPEPIVAEQEVTEVEEPEVEVPSVAEEEEPEEKVELTGSVEYDEADWEEVDEADDELEEDEYEEEYEEIDEEAATEDEYETAEGEEELEDGLEEEAEYEEEEDAEYEEGEELEYEEDEYEEAELEEDEAADVEEDEDAELEEDEYEEYEYEEEDDEDELDSEAA